MHVLAHPENIIKNETDKIFKDSVFMQQEIQRVIDKKLNFEVSLSEIKKLQAFTSYDLCEFEKICYKKYISSEFAKNYCNIPLDANQNLSIRNVATTKMAELLSVQDLIANSIRVNIQNKNGEILEGILMDCADGIESEKLIHKKIKIEPSMQRDLTSLQVFDSICGQCDRFYKNYNIVLSSKGTAIGLCAFDNDWSFSLDTDMKRVRAWLPPIINKEG